MDLSTLGRFLISKKEPAIAAFKTPKLRNALLTGPCFHDGSQETLWDVSDHYSKGAGLQSPYLDAGMQLLALTEGDIDDVVAFLGSLTSGLQGGGHQRAGAPREVSHTKWAQRDMAGAFGPKLPQSGPLRRCS